MLDEVKKYHVQLNGPSGVVYVHDKAQRFIESGRNQEEIERILEDRKMSVDPISGTCEGNFLGCWIEIRELPEKYEDRMEKFIGDNLESTTELD
ncbi:MAG: hypothetical protein KZQ85_10785 [Candidatus Thiodiazotropha sp. (ex Myrtea sp. 'scaly one' KF741663)]|nr:hypothetical protein [Candidatus Thiodiazotropha sp. (ex Myrtea sp. 'scaly one' KF741663)]